MSQQNLSKILSESGFSNHKDTYYTLYIIENINISNFYPDIDFIGVPTFDPHHNPSIYICFKDNVPETQNFGLSLDMDGYMEDDYSSGFIYKIFNSNDDLIEELRRLNSVGLNIKG